MYQLNVCGTNLVLSWQAVTDLMEDSLSVKSNDSTGVSDEYEFVAGSDTVSPT